MAVIAIKGRPRDTKEKIYFNSLTRSGTTFTITFSVDPFTVNNTKNPYRIQKFYVFMRASDTLHDTDPGENFNCGYRENVVAGAVAGKTTYTCTLTIDPNKTFPLSYDHYYCQYVSVGIYGCNSAGNGKVFYCWDTAGLNYTINRPPECWVGTPTYNRETNTMTCSVSTNSKMDLSPRQRVLVRVFREDFIDGKLTASRQVVSDQYPIGGDWEDTTSATLTETSSPALTGSNDYCKWTIKAKAQGWNGENPNWSDSSVSWENSDNDNVVYDGWKQSTIYKAYPAIPTIQNITRVKPEYNASGAIKTNTDGVNVTWLSNQCKRNPTEKTILQFTCAEKRSDILEDDWTDVGETFTVNQCGTFLSSDTIKKKISNGKHVWVRVKATCYNDYETPSVVQMLDDAWYYVSSSTKDIAPSSVIKVVKATRGSDNKSIVVTLGYNDDNYNGCELAYSTDQYAWESTDEPTTYTMADGKWQDATTQSTDHAYTSTITIGNLDEDTDYWIGARRIDINDSDKFTLWSERVSCNTSAEVKEAVVLNAVDKVAVGKDFTFSWSLNEDDSAKQTKWTLYVDGNPLICNENALTTFAYSFKTAGTYTCSLKTEYDNKKVRNSNEVKITAVDVPSCEFSVAPPSQVSSLPLAFTVTPTINGETATDADVDIRIVSACTNIKSRPDGNETQFENDVVWQQVGKGEQDVSMSIADTLWNAGAYTIKAVASNQGSKGEEISQSFTVAYTDTVEVPDDTAVIRAVDADTKQAQIQVNELADGTTWSLYRSTIDGVNTLIARGLTKGQVVTDSVAPYSETGENSYIVLVENDNGQYDFADYNYTLKGSNLRFDWDGKSVEVPYNLEISDSNDKQFEQQVYLDGTQKGSWGASVVRTASLSTDFIYITDAEKISLIRELARYQGAVFVRTPLGQAYCANVEVNEISKKFDSKAIAVSFDCTEVDCISLYKAGSA